MPHIDDIATRRFGRLMHCLGGLVTVTAAVVAYATLYAPAMRANERTQERILDLKEALDEAPVIARRHATLSRELQQMEQRLANIRRRVPQQAQESEFLASLSSLADEVGFLVTSLSPGSPRRKAGYSELEISITGTATYEGLCRFIDAICNSPRLVQIVGLDVRHEADGEGTYPVTVTVAIFFDLSRDHAGQE